VEVLEQLGYHVRFADVDLDGWTLDPASVEAACAAGRVRVVVCVDTFGNPARYGALRAVCDRHGAALVGDSAASIGARAGGVPVGTQADAHAFSMSFAKVLSAGGAGGAVVLRRGDRAAAAVARWERSALMGELNAVAALDQLEILQELVARRREIAAIYERELASRPWLARQRVAAGDAHAYVHWVMRLRRPGLRDPLMRELARRGVGTRDYFRALHHIRPGASKTPLAVTELLDGCALALPMSSELTPTQAADAAEVVDVAYAALTPTVRSCFPASQSAGTSASSRSTSS
jgi:dTDP-4-amino-4,6-dideoxygalactose transaminase